MDTGELIFPVVLGFRDVYVVVPQQGVVAVEMVVELKRRKTVQKLRHSSKSSIAQVVDESS